MVKERLVDPETGWLWCSWMTTATDEEFEAWVKEANVATDLAEEMRQHRRKVAE